MNFVFIFLKIMSFGIPLCGLLKSMARLSGRDHDPTPQLFSLPRALRFQPVLKVDPSLPCQHSKAGPQLKHRKELGQHPDLAYSRDMKVVAQRRGAGWEDKPTLHV